MQNTNDTSYVSKSRCFYLDKFIVKKNSFSASALSVYNGSVDLCQSTQLFRSKTLLQVTAINKTCIKTLPITFK